MWAGFPSHAPGKIATAALMVLSFLAGLDALCSAISYQGEHHNTRYLGAITRSSPGRPPCSAYSKAERASCSPIRARALVYAIVHIVPR